MKNKAFSKLSIPEKEAKISSVLDSKTNGLLYAAELQRIAEALPLRQQYTVKLYRSNADYWHVLSGQKHPHPPDSHAEQPRRCFCRGHLECEGPCRYASAAHFYSALPGQERNKDL